MAEATFPISSLRSRPGTFVAVLPSASSPMLPTTPIKGREMVRLTATMKITAPATAENANSQVTIQPVRCAPSEASLAS